MDKILAEKNCLNNLSQMSLPGTPNLKKIGFGTGVGVFHLSPRNKNGNSPWALKKLLRGNIHNTVMGERLCKEAEILKILNHPNIVAFKAFLRTPDGRECLAMEECHTSLGDIIEQKIEKGPFPSKIACRVAIEIAKALDYIHNTVLLLHGDIKSHNILVKGDFDCIKLCDFGVSLPLTPEGFLNKEAVKNNATYIGTALWNAPEVLRSKTPVIVTDKADIFSYGLTLWEMMAISPPHSMNLLYESDESFDEELYEKNLEKLIGTRPDVPENVSSMNEYSDIINLFNQCCEENYLNRLNARQVLNFCISKKF